MPRQFSSHSVSLSNLRVSSLTNLRLFLYGCIALLLFWFLLLPMPLAQAQADAPPITLDRRLRPNLQIEYLNNIILPSQTFEDSTVGGLSALTYDPKTGKFYALSDDRGTPPNQPRIYELSLTIDSASTSPQLTSATIERVIYLQDGNGEPYGSNFDPEGLALTPQGSFFISTEGNPAQGLAPGIFEFERDSGSLLREIPVPEKFQPIYENQTVGDETQTVQTAGVQTNQGFESLSISATGTAPGEPLRLFVATEGPLVQDRTIASINGTPRDRFLHYYLGEGRPLLIAEHLYPLNPLTGSLFHGLSEILALDGEGNFLSLERALTPLGFDIKLFQISLAGADDISTTPSLRGNVQDIEPVQKQLLLNLNGLGIPLDNLEGMSWGPRLPDGSRSLLLISDDNFKSFQKTQILLFKVGAEK